ncbi:hypothetical protein ONZ45_g13461 [Pleurotus djamor]|nr:hypothetical protein ONZ45_g13461 [Pleurotus djamor]
MSQQVRPTSGTFDGLPNIDQKQSEAPKFTTIDPKLVKHLPPEEYTGPLDLSPLSTVLDQRGLDAHLTPTWTSEIERDKIRYTNTWFPDYKGTITREYDGGVVWEHGLGPSIRRSPDGDVSIHFPNGKLTWFSADGMSTVTYKEPILSGNINEIDETPPPESRPPTREAEPTKSAGAAVGTSPTKAREPCVKGELPNRILSSGAGVY